MSTYTDSKKKWYLNNKEKIFKEQYFCEICNVTVKKYNKSAHLRTKLHELNSVKKENEQLKQQFNYSASN